MHRNIYQALLCALGIVAVSAPFQAKATVVDLVNSDTGWINGAFFQTTDIQPTGTGVFEPFLTIQAKGSEQGYNGTNGNFDTKRVSKWNHEIRLSDLHATSIGDVAYYSFVIDINEPNSGSAPLISLTSLKIYTSTTIQDITSTDANGNFNGLLGTLQYDLGIGNSVAYLDTENGSGSGDIAFFIPVSLFSDASPDDFVYVYEQFTGTSGGFEETSILNAQPIVSK